MEILRAEFNLKDKVERTRGVSMYLITYMNKIPLLANMLITYSDIEDVEEGSKALAYTYVDVKTKRTKICLNFNYLQDGMKITKEPVSLMDKLMGEKEPEYEVVQFTPNAMIYLILHELLHNFFNHFTREPIKFYAKKSKELTNIVIDYYCNEFINRLIEVEPETHAIFKKIGIINQESLNQKALEWFQEELPFYYDSKPIETKALEWFFEKAEEKLEDLIKNGKVKLVAGDGDGEGFPMPLNGLDDHEEGEKQQKKSIEKENKDRIDKGEVPMNESEVLSNIESTLKNQISNAMKESKGKGANKGEADLERFFGKIYKKDPFLNFMVIKNAASKIIRGMKVRTYSKGNRKKHDAEIIFKGKKRLDGKHLVVGVDVSGSVSNKELEAIYNWLGTFLMGKKGDEGVSIDVIFWSSCKLGPEHLYENIVSWKDLLKMKVNSSGGTEVSYLYDFVREHYGKKKVTLLNLTDGDFYNKPELPDNVTEHYIVLTMKGYEEQLQESYPKAKIRVARIYENEEESA